MKKKLEINILFLVFLYFAILTIFVDYLTFFFNASYGINLIIGIPITAVIFYFLRKKIKIQKNFDKGDIFFLTFFLIIIGLTIVFPDKMYDTINYHLYNQVYPFADKINKDFFPNSFIQSFSYAYPDRIFYIFRYILGYRLGNILNYFLIATLYLQVKNILENVFKVKGYAKNIISTFAILSLSIIDIMDTYYIDIISLVILFEVFDKVLFGPLLSEDKESNNNIISYLGLLTGLAFATKISNMFFILMFAIVYLFKNRKKLKNIGIISYLLFICLSVIPCILYIYNTWKQTGNPVFPFYNQIFKSQYYSNTNWMDTRFGPSRFLEVIFWPILILKYPNRTIDISVVEPIWAFGYVISFIYIGYSFIMKFRKKKYNTQKFYFAIICVLSNLVWAKFTLGYVRYGFIVLVLNNMITFIFLYDVIRNKKIMAITVMSLLLFYNYGYCYKLYTSNGGFWSYNNYFAYNENSYRYNLKRIFAKNDTKIAFPKNSAWGTVNSNSGFMKLLNDEIPMIYLKNSDLEKINQQRNSLLEHIEHIYIISDYLEFVNFIPSLNEAGYHIKEFYDVVQPNYLNNNNLIYIFEIEKNSDESNHYIETNKYIFTSLEKCQKVSFYYGLAGSMLNTKIDGYKIQIIYNNEIIKEEELNANDYSLKYYEYDFEKELTMDDSLYIQVVDNNNVEVSNINLFLLNDRIV